METAVELALGLLVLAVIGLSASVAALSHRLDSLRADQARLMRHLGVDANTEPSHEVRELARDPKRRIDAIRLYRQQTGKDLKAAVEVIDQLGTQR